MWLNHPELPTPTLLQFVKNCPPQNRSLMPRRLGTAVLGAFSRFSLWKRCYAMRQCRFLGMIPESESSNGCGVEWVCVWSRWFEQVHLVILFRYQSVSKGSVSVASNNFPVLTELKITFCFSAAFILVFVLQSQKKKKR